jgi:hypothetical protein
MYIGLIIFVVVYTRGLPGRNLRSLGFKAGIRPLVFPGKNWKRSRSGHQEADPSIDNGSFCDMHRFFDARYERLLSFM